MEDNFNEKLNLDDLYKQKKLTREIKKAKILGLL